MKIARVTATALNVPLHIKLIGLDHKTSLACCFVDVETDSGIVGHGLTSITEEDVIAQIVNGVAGPAIIGDDPLAHERVWDKLYWTMMPRGQTGYAAHALAAIDVALWDIKGKALGQPVWRLLGGARDRAPVYATFGFGFFDREQLAAAAKLWVSQGFRRLKMTVGNEALRNRDTRPLMDVIREDAARVRAVREAVGPGDRALRRRQLQSRPLSRDQARGDDQAVRHFVLRGAADAERRAQMAQLRRATNMALACGQNEGLAFRFRDLLLHEAVDFVQPNVAITGGFTQCLRIAGLASSFNVSVANGGAWGFHNMHLQAGVANGTLVEHHYLAVELYKQIYRDLPMPADGYFTMPDTPGLGFEPNRDAIREIAKLPLSQGSGKG